MKIVVFFCLYSNVCFSTFYLVDHFGFPTQKGKEQQLAAEQFPSILSIRNIKIENELDDG